MGDIGPYRQRYEVLPVPEFGLDDADRWTVDRRPAPLAPALPPELPERHRSDESRRT